MNKSNNVSEVGLMVTYKKNIVIGQIFEMLRAFDTQFVYEIQPGIRKYANYDIYDSFHEAGLPKNCKKIFHSWC